ncbi:probable ATP-dependent RNA helicase DDX20 [Conger conger]|uniref:probable ATP-dependent RNA helicase DDX20 n=1 Tax=Conger conger TaxID=82655 RepID=UPI002A5A82D0|nr:probable ATP-dependent RNA helicase DDX20 [Conger conger]
MASLVKKAAHDIQTRRRTDDVLLSDGIDFASLLLSQPVQDGLLASGFQKPSPIQLKAIPLGRCGLDLIVQAKSGTGKTCVFATIALDALITENMTTQVLVLAPTREIAVQIHAVVMAIGSAMEGLECHVFIGGTPVSQDKTRLKRCHVAVGSPGRIKQLIELGFLSTASIRLFVLDEADKLLEEGSFQDQINWIYSSLPVNKQMLALSATYPESMAQHLTRYMREPTFVRLNPADPGLIGLKQYYRVVKSHPLPHKIFEEKVQQLFELFSKIPFNQALVFSNLHSRAQHLADILTTKGLPAACISGGLSQDQRLEAMSKLKQYQCRVLISTDLTSRGIDADKVNLVINLDVPQDWETYMHRIGRAGRFGTHGLAVTYCCRGEEENKMVAIAQKCSLSLSLLPDPIPPGLMEEPSDYDVTIENLKTEPIFEVSQRPDKKKRLKTAPVPKSSWDENSRTTENVPERSTKGTHVGQGANEGTPMQPKKAAPVPPASPVQEAPRPQTRRELQEALPKIPPLPSFKPKVPVVTSFEHLVMDYERFITEGPGRSVEIIRRYTGPEGVDEVRVLESSPSVRSQDIRSSRSPARPAPSMFQSPGPVPSRSRSRSPAPSGASSSSDMDLESGRSGAPDLPGRPDRTRGVRCGEASPGLTGGSSASGPSEPQATTRLQLQPKPQPPPQPYPQTKHPPSPQTQKGPQAVKKLKSCAAPAWGTRGGKTGQRVSHGPREGTAGTGPREDRHRAWEEEDQQAHHQAWEEEDQPARHQAWEEEDQQARHQAWHQAWERYYAAVPQAYQQGYNSAYSWMAAYRMNSIYMEELLKR